MKLSVFVLSHNKNGFVQEAIASILDQDYEDFELILIDNSTDGVTRESLVRFLDATYADDPRIEYTEVEVPDEVRRTWYVPSWLLNRYYPQATGDVILYLSDDDLFVPGLFSAVATAFEDNVGWKALYFHLARTIARNPGEGMTWDSRFTGIPADCIRGDGEVDCQIDACQIAYRTHVLTDIGQPYFPEEQGHGNHADGVHLQKIAQKYLFHPLAVCGIIHRHTAISTWSKG